MWATLIFLVLGFVLGYFVRGLKANTHSTKVIYKSMPAANTYQQKLLLKSHHQTDSDRIRELNQLNRNQSVFLRLLKQTFTHHEIAIKQTRFIILDRDYMPCAIFEYRDGTQAMKLIDQEDGLPLYLYKGLISSDELKQDYLSIISTQK
ncbi:hypothetical protein [Acinetobacter bouvetii]|uniref:Uncharacterized protein n=1 Tax=Acinetobacter bouvetii TaxID=202951 RepID=A0A811GGY2_9GAMM|nr:hypothetical protein [Acinetobacter bouvetii]CAB1211883.1 hypothetical protein SFB21_0970 [Acinetobacter bouvetii]